MHYIFKNFTAYGTLLLIFVLFTTFFGCEAQNPVCSDNFCVVGEVFLRSDLEANQEFSEVDVDDSLILATLIGTTPVEPTVDDPPTLESLVADVAAGGVRYAGKIITITAEVQSGASSFTNNDAITLVTNNADVWFYVISRETPARLANYEQGKSYTFNLFIQEIEPPDEFFAQYAIWTHIPVERVTAEMNALVTDVIAGGKNYIDKIVEIQATVRDDSAFFAPHDTITLDTNNDTVRFFVSNSTADAVILDAYEKGSTYPFTLFIRDIAFSTTGDSHSIWAHIVVE